MSSANNGAGGKSTALMEYLFVGGGYCTASASMFLINKIAIHAFNLPFILLFFQNAVTLLVMWIASYFNGMFAPDVNWKESWRWLPAVGFFLINLTSSLKAMTYVSVPAMVVLRNLNSLSVAAMDRYINGKVMSLTRIMSLFVITIGAIVYGYWDMQFDARGYGWTIANLSSMAFYTLFVKWVLNKYKFEPMEMTMMNNVYSLPFLLLLSLGFQENHQLFPALDQLGANSQIALVISGIMGFGISYFGFKAQKTFSPTAWITLNNMNKIPTIFLGLLLFQSSISFQSLVGIALSIGGGFVFAREGLKEKDAPVKPLPPAEEDENNKV